MKLSARGRAGRIRAAQNRRRIRELRARLDALEPLRLVVCAPNVGSTEDVPVLVDDKLNEVVTLYDFKRARLLALELLRMCRVRSK